MDRRRRNRDEREASDRYDDNGGGSRQSRRHRQKKHRVRSESPVASRLRRNNHQEQQPSRYAPAPSDARTRRGKRSDRSPVRSRSRSRSRSRRHGGDARSTRTRSPRARRRSGSRSRPRRSTRERELYRRREYDPRGSSRSQSPRLTRNRSYRSKKKQQRRERSSWSDERQLQHLQLQQQQPYSDNEGSDASSAHDDTIGSFDGQPGDYIANRYKIIREAGLGTFGRVLECHDKQRNIVVAIKVVRQVDKYTESAKIEAAILQDVNDRDVTNTSLCVRMYKWFEYNGHVCLVFERLGCSLYDYLKAHDYKPFPLASIRAYAWQLLTALEFIHSIRLIHTDLKPENILLVHDDEARAVPSPRSTTSNASSSRSRSPLQQSQQQHAGGRLALRPPACDAVKLIDFGGATYDDESKSSVINTRQYRSPEVILGLGWSYPSDIWSAGCILAELYLGELLFATHENLEHLALIERCIGRLPPHMVTSANKTGSKFFRRTTLDWPAGATSDESVEHVRKMRTLAQLVAPDDAAAGLLDLLQLMLILDPDDRVTAQEALNNPFFDGFSMRNIVETNDGATTSSSHAVSE